MIPIKLSLTNFMCYRQETVNFEGIHVACLSGDNGAGKSALLDGITWAVWGKARARRDDELITLGQKEMQVEFTFQLGPNIYRAIRKRKGGKRGSSLLDFQIKDEDEWRSIAENTIRDSQDKIEHILRLDYDTFVNSAFLRQGRADEFTIKTPAERKRVLGEILGLNVWTEYEEQTKQRLRATQDQVNTLNSRLEEIELELARRDEYESQVMQARQEVDELGAKLTTAQAAYQEIETARAELRRSRSQLEELGERIAQTEQEIAALTEEQAQHQARLEEYRDLLSRSEEVEAGYAAYQQALELERQLGAKLSAQAELDQRRSALEAEVAEARHALMTKQEVALQRAQELEGRLPEPELRQSYHNLREEIEYLVQLRQGKEAAQADLSRLAEERAALQSQNMALKPEMETLKERIELLKDVKADCPLCGQSLSEAERLQLVEQLQEEGTEKGNTYRANQDRLEEIAAEIAGLENQIAQSEPELASLPQAEMEAATLAERLRVADEVTQSLEAARSELATLMDEIAAEEYAPKARQALAETLAEASKLGYDAAAHATARQAVSEGQPFAELKAQLAAAADASEREERALAQIAETSARRDEQLTNDRTRQQELEQECADLTTRLERSDEIEQELAQARTAEAEARQRLGAAEQRLAACDALAQQKESRGERRDELIKLQGIYEELRTAFGVQGVPAMIIEAAVPEIEREANRLLGRMTAGRMHVNLETQRETQAGHLRETLDIRIMDEVGERNYENYSGGEQFRVNFALRIALSRLLARRAGAQLQTLIVDEGFGTQDARGRERLVEAIHSIQDEFERILVITHIEELQDAFPVRIHVTKSPAGSTVELA